MRADEANEVGAVPADPGAISQWTRGLVRSGPFPATGWIKVVSTEMGEEFRIVGTGHGRGRIAVGFGSIWVANRFSRTIGRLDAEGLELTAMQRLRKPPVQIVAGPDSVWAAGANGWVWRIWPAGPAAEGVARLSRRPVGLVAGEGAVWALHRSGRLVRIDPGSGDVAMESRVGRSARALVAAGDSLWAATDRGRRLARIDPGTGASGPSIPLPRPAVALATFGDAIWAACRGRGSAGRGALHRIDTTGGRTGEAIEVALPSSPRALAVGADAIWVACGARFSRYGTVERVDPYGGVVQRWHETEWAVSDLAVSGDDLLIAMSLGFGGPDGSFNFMPLAGAAGGGDGGGGGS